MEIVNHLKEYAKAHHLVDWDAPLSVLCRKLHIAYLEVNSINSPYVVERVTQKGVDVLVNAGGGIFRSKLIPSHLKEISFQLSSE